MGRNKHHSCVYRPELKKNGTRVGRVGAGGKIISWN